MRVQDGRNWCIPAAVSAAMEDLGPGADQKDLVLAYCKEHGKDGLSFKGEKFDLTELALEDDMIVDLAKDADLPLSNFDTFATLAARLDASLRFLRRSVTEGDLGGIDWSNERVILAGKNTNQSHHAYLIRGVSDQGLVVWDPHDGAQRTRSFNSMTPNGDALIISR